MSTPLETRQGHLTEMPAVTATALMTRQHAQGRHWRYRGGPSQRKLSRKAPNHARHLPGTSETDHDRATPPSRTPPPIVSAVLVFVPADAPRSVPFPPPMSIEKHDMARFSDIHPTTGEEGQGEERRRQSEQGHPSPRGQRSFWGATRYSAKVEADGKRHIFFSRQMQPSVRQRTKYFHQTLTNNSAGRGCCSASS